MAHTKSRSTFFPICPAMAVLSRLQPRRRRPTLAAAPDANPRRRDLAHATSSRHPAGDPPPINVKLRSHVTAEYAATIARGRCLSLMRVRPSRRPRRPAHHPDVHVHRRLAGQPLGSIPTARAPTFSQRSRQIDSDLSDLTPGTASRSRLGPGVPTPSSSPCRPTPNVETAYVSTDRHRRQHRLHPVARPTRPAAPDGIDAASANRLPDEQAKNVAIFDIQANWDTKHKEDLGPRRPRRSSPTARSTTTWLEPRTRTGTSSTARRRSPVHRKRQRPRYHRHRAEGRHQPGQLLGKGEQHRHPACDRPRRRPMRQSATPLVHI